MFLYCKKTITESNGVSKAADKRNREREGPISIDDHSLTMLPAHGVLIYVSVPILSIQTLSYYTYRCLF